MTRSEAAALLDVPEDASAADVQHAYLRAARRTHPDVLPEADDAARRTAAVAFDRLTRARDLLVAWAPTGGPRTGTGRSAAPRYRRPPRRDLGGSFVVLALLAFLLMGIVAAEQAYRGSAADPPASAPAATSGP